MYSIRKAGFVPSEKPQSSVSSLTPAVSHQQTFSNSWACWSCFRRVLLRVNNVDVFSFGICGSAQPLLSVYVEIEGNSSWHSSPASTAINYFTESMFCYFLWSCSIFVCAVEEITWQNPWLIFLSVCVPANGCCIWAHSARGDSALHPLIGSYFLMANFKR